MQVVPKEEFQEWLQHPVTQAFRKYLSNNIRDFQEGWSNGAFTGATSDETIQLNSKAIGQIQILQNILEIDEGVLNGE